ARAESVPADTRLEILRRAVKFCKQQAQQQSSSSNQSQQASGKRKQQQQKERSASVEADSAEAAAPADSTNWPAAAETASSWLQHARSVRERLLPLLLQQSSSSSSSIAAAAAALGPDRSDAEQLIERLLTDQSVPLESTLAVAEVAKLTGADVSNLLRFAVRKRICEANEDADWIIGLSSLLDELREPLQSSLAAAINDAPVLAALKDCLGSGQTLSADRRLSVSGMGDLLALWPPCSSEAQQQRVATNYLTPAWLAWLDACGRLGQAGRDLAVARAIQQQQQEQYEESSQQQLLLWPPEVYNRAYEICLLEDDQASRDWDSACTIARLSAGSLIDSFLTACESAEPAPALRSDTLLSLVDAGLAGKLPGSCLYPQFVSRLLADRSSKSSNRLAQTIEQLRTAGCQPEAAWLMMEQRGGGCHPGLRTWDNAAALLRML
uniref:Nuclear pore complex protein Nup85 n=1 Tax=Macrostomum lignano TaxID=282301 RepID=A0A1I8G1E8_9PLAT